MYALKRTLDDGIDVEGHSTGSRVRVVSQPLFNLELHLYLLQHTTTTQQTINSKGDVTNVVAEKSAGQEDYVVAMNDALLKVELYKFKFFSHLIQRMNISNGMR